MSETITNYLTNLRSSIDPEVSAQVKFDVPEMNAKGNIDTMYRVAQGAGGFVAYFVLNNTENDGFHDEQHALFCQELGIDDSLHVRSYPISTNAEFAAVLKRSLHVHDDTVHGIWYDVEHIPFDRD